MKRFWLLTFALVPLVLGMASCEKAHKAGNDSMRAPSGVITAVGG